jgi:hypothetical protein
MGERNYRRILVVAVIVVVAGLLARAYDVASDAPWIPKLKLPGAAPSAGRKKAKRGKGKLTSVPVGVEQSNARLDVSAQYEMDSLLDKISAGGMESLSSAERKRLEQLSKQLRGK